MRKLLSTQTVDSLTESQQHTSHKQWEIHASTGSYPDINIPPYIKGPEPSSKCTNQLSIHLHALHVSPKLAGYRCLLAAIPMFAENPRLMMKEVYPDIARSHGFRDSRCVEHVIRIAVHKAWANRNISTWAYYFPLNRNGDIDRPSNKEFIARLAEEL